MRETIDIAPSARRSAAARAVAEHIVPRPRVAEHITARLRRYPVVRVIAPPGSGKTTALEEVASALEPPVTWLPLQEWHRAPGKLVDDLVGALDSVVPGLRARIVREGAHEAGPPQAAALVGAMGGHAQVVIVLDDCHVVEGARDAEEALGAFLQHAHGGLHVVLAGRRSPAVKGLGVDALHPDATIGEDVLRADVDEAEAILRGRGSNVDASVALAATGGWVAGLVFESWGAASVGNADPLAAFLAQEVRPALSPADDRLLVDSSIFDSVAPERLVALGCTDPHRFLERLREIGIPARWLPLEAGMRLHPRVREVLHADLERRPRDDRRRVAAAAAAALQAEGELERALELSLDAGDGDAARRLLPQVIVGIVERGDIDLAERYLDTVQLERTSAEAVLARLMIASRRQRRREGTEVLDAIDDPRLPAMLAEQPTIGPFACNFLAASGELDRAEAVLERMPAGRAADAARFILSLARNDPAGPVPALEGDSVDVVVARGLWCRGKLRRLDTASRSLLRAAGIPYLPVQEAELEDGTPPLATQLIELARAIQERDASRAHAAVDAIAARPAPIWAALGEAEVAVRIERDPEKAVAAADRAGSTRIPFFDELADVWRGAALLLRLDADGAARVLRAAVESMQRGDRSLALPKALVYLAEAEWRLGHEEEADRAADRAHEVALENGSMRELLFALSDFPGVTSRRIDAERSADSMWHALGRALVIGAGRTRAPSLHAGVHLHDLGEPSLALEGGRVVRAKLRKSLELLAFLLSRPEARATRSEALTALWNGRDDDSARAYLRQALRHLRDAVEPAVTVATDGDDLAIAGAVSADSLTLDVLVASAAHEQGESRLALLLEALEIARRGTFLSGSQDVLWIDDRRRTLASLLADIRLDTSALLLGAERHLEALEFADEALAANPLLERGWRLRMTALSLLGDSDGVTTTYARCRATLAEIGLEPSETTTQLASSLRR